MASFNFGYAANAAQVAALAHAGRNTSPPGMDMASNFNTGDATKAQVAYLRVIDGSKDFLWGSHLWESSKHKVTR